MKKVMKWRETLRLWSVQANIFSTLVMLQGMLPLWEGIVEKKYFLIIGAVLNTAVVFFRNLKQRPKKNATPST